MYREEFLRQYAASNLKTEGKALLTATVCGEAKKQLNEFIMSRPGEGTRQSQGHRVTPKEPGRHGLVKNGLKGVALSRCIASKS